MSLVSLRLCLSPAWLLDKCRCHRENKEKWQKWQRNRIGSCSGLVSYQGWNDTERRWIDVAFTEIKLPIWRYTVTLLKWFFSVSNCRTIPGHVSFSVGCRCFGKRLSPVFGVMSLDAPTPWKLKASKILCPCHYLFFYFHFCGCFPFSYFFCFLV